MIDGGPANVAKSFSKYLKVCSIQPNDIKLIVLTHGDFDHVGSAKNIKKLTGAKLPFTKKIRPTWKRADLTGHKQSTFMENSFVPYFIHY